MKDNKSNALVILAYLAVCIIWGSTYFAMRIAVSKFPPELFAGIRFFTAGMIVLAFVVIKKYPFPNSFADAVKSAVPGICMLMGANGLVMWAEQWVHSGVTSLLLATTPLFVALLDVLFFKGSKIGLSSWICLLVGFASIAMLIASGSGIGSIDLAGGLIVLIASACWSLGAIYSSKVKYSGHIFSHVGIQMVVAGTGLIIIGLIMGEASRISFDINTILAMVYLIFFGSIIGYSSNTYVLDKWPASVAVTSTYVNPVVAVMLGVLFLDESLNSGMVISMIFTLGSVVTLHLIKYGVFSKIAGAWDRGINVQDEPEV